MNRVLRGRGEGELRPFRGKGFNSTTLDPHQITTQVLSCASQKVGLSEVRRLSHLNEFVKLLKTDLSLDQLGYSTYEILYCLRPLCFLDSTKLKNAAFRAIRYCIRTERDVDDLIQLKYDFLIAKEITAGGLQLCRRILVIAPLKLTHAPVRAIVSFVHPSHTDNLQSPALAFLAELALLNPDVFIICGGVSAIIRNLPCLKSEKMTEALVGSLLYLTNRPESRLKAGINLHCLTGSVYMDRALNSKNTTNSPETAVRWCTTAMICLLKSWTGILHLCQGQIAAIASIVDSLYVSHLQKPILEVLYNLFDLTQPNWTDEMSVALEAVNSSRSSNNFRIAEGFVAAEVHTLFPHLAKSRVNLKEVHQAFVLYLFLRANLLEGIVHVIVSEDTFLSVHATILLGELLHLVHTILPPDLIDVTPGLPNLLSYAVLGRPVNFGPTVWSDQKESNVTVLEDLLGPDFAFDQIGRSDLRTNKEAQQRALRAVCAMSCLHRKTPTPSLYLRHLIYCIQGGEETQAKPSPLSFQALNSCDDAIKDSGVLIERDPYTWKWDVIRANLKRHGETLRKSVDSNKKMFLRRLMNFFLPVTGQYGRTELGPDRVSYNRITLAFLDLVSALLPSPENSDGEKLLLELLTSVKTQLVDLARSAHDSHWSPINISNSLCQDYFLMLGQLSASALGRAALTKSSIYNHLMELATSTNHDCYIKLIVSSMDFAKDTSSRHILEKIFESKSVSCRLYATKALHAMLRIGVGHDKSLMSFLIGLIVDQLSDEDRNVASVALSALQEASHSREYVEALVEQRPCLMRHGDFGLLVLVRCLSTEQGFWRLHQANFVSAQLAKWGSHYNFKYVNIVENFLISENCDSKEQFLPPHLYQQLASHQAGLALVLADEHVNNLAHVLERVSCSSNREILETKAALYALSGIAAVMENSVLTSMIRIATECQVYSVRAVALIALSNVATSSQGVEKLKTMNWFSVRHNRHERWPLVFPREEREYHIPEANKSELVETPKETLWSLPGGATRKMRDTKSATLPHGVSSGGAGSPYIHYRSYSESKAEHSDSDYITENVRYEAGTKSRSNSYTDSSTSGDSTYGARHHTNDRIQTTLSPIPSSGSLSTYQSQGPRTPSHFSNLTRRTSLRRSRTSISKPFDSLDFLVVSEDKFADLDRGWRDQIKETPEPDFSVLDSFPSDLSESVKSTNDDVPTSIYMGVSLPADLFVLFPNEEKNVVKKHVVFVSENLKRQGGIEELKNPNFHKDICFMGSTSIVHNTMVKYSESESDLVEDVVDLDKDDSLDDSPDSSFTDVPSFVGKPLPILLKCRTVLRNELARMVEQLSNPMLHKTCRTSLLQMKQAHGHLFSDICVFSDVCHILSTCQVRIASRDFVNELFDCPFDQVWEDAATFLALKLGTGGNGN